MLLRGLSHSFGHQVQGLHAKLEQDVAFHLDLKGALVI